MKRLLTGILCLLAFGLLSARSGRADDQHPFPLRNARADVLTVYSTLRVMPRGDAKLSFSQLSPEMKADVWTLHLEQFLDEHQNLLEEQREVIFEGLGLLASGLPAKLVGTSDSQIRSTRCFASSTGECQAPSLRTWRRRRSCISVRS